MDVFEAIQERRSIRAYQQKTVPKNLLLKILDAARLAPSARNVEPWHFIVVTDAKKREALSKGAFAKFLSEAPVVIVACGDAKASPKWYRVDVAIACENLVLAATGEGLGTCWVGSFKKDEVKAVVGVPEHLEVVALLAVGYAREKVDLSRRLLYLVRRRKILSEIASMETYGNRILPESAV